MASATYERNINQPKLLTYKSMPVLLEGNIAARKKSKIRTAFTSMGLAIPFQPSMWDEKSIKSVWNNGMEMVKAKLKSRYSEEYTNTILTRLEKLYQN
jgi:RIO-like serine/threonine protein kinase